MRRSKQSFIRMLTLLTMPVALAGVVAAQAPLRTPRRNQLPARVA